MLKVYNSVLKESLLDSPFAPRKNEIAPAVAAALIAGGSSILSNVIGGVSNSAAQREANETNLQIARETNKFNYDIHQSDIAQQWAMWRAQNEYNDPYSVIQRLQRAGVNPAFLGGQALSSPASSMNVPSGSPMLPTSVQPVQSPFGSFASGLFEGVSQGVNAYFQNELLNSQIKSNDVDTNIKQVQLQTEAVRNYLDLSDKLADVRIKMQNLKKGTIDYKKAKAEYKYLKYNVKLMKDTYNALVERESLQNDVMRSQKANLDENAALAKSQEAAVSMGLKFTEAQTRYIFANINDMVERLAMDKELKDASIAEIQSRVIHMINEDAAIFEQIGISKEMMASEKFKNYVGTTVHAIATGVGLVSLTKGLKRPSPLKPEPYTSVQSPWVSYGR